MLEHCLSNRLRKDFRFSEYLQFNSSANNTFRFRFNKFHLSVVDEKSYESYYSCVRAQTSKVPTCVTLLFISYSVHACLVYTLLYLLSFVETPRKFINGRIFISANNTDEDPSARIESSAIVDLRGVSTKLNKYIVFALQTYKELNIYIFLSLYQVGLDKVTSFCIDAQESRYWILVIVR